MQKTITPIIVASIAGLAACKHEKKPAIRPMNVIFVLADDMGYGSLGCYGQEKIKTPHIDSLAAEGIRFTRFYSAQTVSAPSRCGLLTGMHMGSAYIRANDPPVEGLKVGDGLPLRDEDYTLSELFKEQRYVTAAFGKWGLGMDNSSGSPEKQGFDNFYGYLNQADAHKYQFKYQEEIIDGKISKIAIDSNAYTHELQMEKAFEFIQKHKDTSFFLFLPVAIPHTELFATTEDLSSYLDENGNSIFENEIPYLGGAPFPGAHSYSPIKYPKATYAAMISRLDKDMGKIKKMLKELGIADNTLIIFTSDNGAETGKEGLDADFFKANGALKGYKRDLYEGGIRVPFIAWNPKLIKKSRTIDYPIAFWDIMPTMAEMLGSDLPANTNGKSFFSILQGKTDSISGNVLYWEFQHHARKEHVQVFMLNNFKLLKRKIEGKEIEYELYDLSTDISENKNLAAQMPEKVKELHTLLIKESNKPDCSCFADFNKIMQ